MGLVLAYHDIVPVGADIQGDRSLHLPQHEFARQLDALSETHDFVSLTEILQPAWDAVRPRAAITFDDAYLGAVTAGVAELVRRRIPATIFVAPGLLGCTPWWDILASSSDGIIPRRARAYALSGLGGQHQSIVSWARALEVKRSRLSPDVRIALRSELETASRWPGITLESHTWSHPNLTSLSAGALGLELSRSVDWLEQCIGARPRFLSYPYGLHSPDVQRASMAAGYLAAFRVDGGWLVPDSSNAFGLPRLNIPRGLSIDGFRLRVAGLMASR